MSLVTPFSDKKYILPQTLTITGLSARNLISFTAFMLTFSFKILINLSGKIFPNIFLLLKKSYEGKNNLYIDKFASFPLFLSR